jgi:hypothetical protein
MFLAVGTYFYNCRQLGLELYGDVFTARNMATYLN